VCVEYDSRFGPEEKFAVALVAVAGLVRGDSNLAVDRLE